LAIPNHTSHESQDYCQWLMVSSQSTMVGPKYYSTVILVVHH